MKTSLRVLLVLALLALAVPAPAGPLPGNLPADGPGIEREGDIEHVANVSYTGGSDLEFATKTVVRLSEGATGDPVCVEAEDGGCLRNEDGDVVYATEERDFAFAGRLSQAVQVIDITDPTDPVRVAEVHCRLNQNDVQVWGDTLLMAADLSGACTRADGTTMNVQGFATADISDPRNPVILGRGQQTTGAHTLTVHPTEPLVYISNSNIDVASDIHIWDISDPAAPVKVRDWAPYPVGEPPHDVTFNAAGDRGYAASQDARTDILDTSDPRNPELISSIFHEGVVFSHQADPTPDGKYLLVSDELGYGFAPGASPGGPIHVYDIRNEMRPVKVGVIGNDATGGPRVTTSHVFRINPDGWTLAIGWYNDGVHVWDFSDIRGVNAAGLGATTGVGPRTIGWMRMPNANTWAAKMWQERHPGYVFANDQGRGFDVFYVESLGPGFVGTGVLRGAALGLTEDEFTGDCDHSPVTQGLDGWVFPVPDGLAGTGSLSVEVESATDVEAGLAFYSSTCQPLGAASSAPVPEGAAYGVVSAETPGHARLSIRAADGD